MRALSFCFALLAGLVLAFIAPALAGGREPAPAALMAPVASGIDTVAADPQDADQLLASLLGELNLEQAAAPESLAIDATV